MNPTTNDADRQDLLDATHRLLDAIAAGDWKTYTELCDQTLSCFEPEAGNHLVEGLGFHKFYFDLPAPAKPRHTTLASPHVRVMGDVGVVSYVRLVQRLDAAGQPQTAMVAETRIWQRQGSAWMHVHFHRSTA
jgi:calcium/calmodulin-dependent protein kinase (CaM kinase) II